jgi:hypothetical protein
MSTLCSPELGGRFGGSKQTPVLDGVRFDEFPDEPARWNDRHATGSSVVEGVLGQYRGEPSAAVLRERHGVKEGPLLLGLEVLRDCGDLLAHVQNEPMPRRVVRCPNLHAPIVHCSCERGRTTRLRSKIGVVRVLPVVGTSPQLYG